MENMFLDVMDASEVTKRNEIIANKQFGKEMVRQLKQVYSLFDSTEDDRDFATVSFKKYAHYKGYGSFVFTFDSEGITFKASVLVYKTYKDSTITRLKDKTPPIDLYNKYKDSGEVRTDDGFLVHGHGHVHFTIKFKRDANNLKDLLRDIMLIMDYDGYNKNYS